MSEAGEIRQGDIRSGVARIWCEGGTKLSE